MIRVQSQAFDPGFELSQLKEGRPGIGGTVMFLGTVRDLSEGADVKAMTLEHYPGMTEKALEDIEQEAHRRWPLDATLIIHRFGRLEPLCTLVGACRVRLHLARALRTARWFVHLRLVLARVVTQQRIQAVET